MPRLWIASTIMLWVVVGLMAWLLAGALRQIGLLQLRLGDDPGALLTDDGLERGTVGPDFEAALIETGEPLRFGSIPGRPHLLVLMSSGFRPEP